MAAEAGHKEVMPRSKFGEVVIRGIQTMPEQQERIEELEIESNTIKFAF
jgi:hypothetical protein